MLLSTVRLTGKESDRCLRCWDGLGFPDHGKGHTSSVHASLPRRPVRGDSKTPRKPRSILVRSSVRQVSSVRHDLRRVCAIIPLPRHQSPFAPHNPTMTTISGSPSCNSISRSCGVDLWQEHRSTVHEKSEENRRTPLTGQTSPQPASPSCYA